jgi:hypothetical protein
MCDWNEVFNYFGGSRILGFLKAWNDISSREFLEVSFIEN